MTSSRTLTRASFFTLAAVAAGVSMLIAIAPARAADPTDPDAVPSVAVHYSDVNVNTTAGAKVVYERIVIAAHSVCPHADPGDLATYSLARSCERAAVDRAVESVHSEQLALVASHSPPIG
jgi:UrcA family protein